MNRRIYGAIDIAKFVCSILILFYHYFSEVDVIGGLFEDVLSLYAVAVALFMAISGFLLNESIINVESYTKKKKKLWKQVKRILIIYFLWSIVYLMYNISKWDFSKITGTFIFWKVQGWVFNTTFYTIWFMPSLAIGLILAFFSLNRLGMKKSIFLALCAYCVSALLSTYSFVGCNAPGFESILHFVSMWLQGTRGGILYGYPLCLLGMIVSEHKGERTSLFWFIVSIISMLMLLLEALILRNCIGNTGIDLAVSMPLVVFSILHFLITIDINQSFNFVMLRNMSLLIFMSQRIFITVLPEIFNAFYQKYVFSNTLFSFIVCCGSTIIFSSLIIVLSRKIPFLKKLY